MTRQSDAAPLGPRSAGGLPPACAPAHRVEDRGSTLGNLMPLTVSLAAEFSGRVPPGAVSRSVAEARAQLLGTGVRDGLVVAVESMARAHLEDLSLEDAATDHRRPRDQDGPVPVPLPRTIAMTPSDQGASGSRTSAPRMPASDELEVLGAHWSLGLLIEAVDEYAIFSLDHDGAIQTWNRGAHRIKGYDEHEILGRHFSVFYLPEDRRAGVPDQALAHAVAHGQWSGEGWRVRKDGSTFWANVVITAVLDQHGNVDSFVKVTRDETARRAAEKTVRELGLIEERARIAIELSKATVRDIFTATLALDSALALNPHPHVAHRIQDAITTLDRSLVHIRSTVTGTTSRDLFGTAQQSSDPGPDAQVADE